MKIHILGICGTFMGGIALLAKQLGHQVSGSDANVYPPMSTQLELSGITLYQGYGIEALQQIRPEMTIIGNALSRGAPAVEYILNERLVYRSGPQWLSEQVLAGKHVIAVSGTHGKTSCTSMLAWILQCAGKQPGFLIGGVAENFGISARLGDSDYFVVEADEYDTAFFDKRSKFIHYHPRTLIINNIEFDHADIFDDIEDIVREFSRLVRVVPGAGQIIYKQDDIQIASVIRQGCWSPLVGFGADQGDWQCRALSDDYSQFDVVYRGRVATRVCWGLIGRHNAENALAVIAAADHIGIRANEAGEALASYRSVKRRLQCLGQFNGITVYDDFAHHPTAIKATLSALRAKIGHGRIIAVLEPRSNTMKLGVHQHTLSGSLADADSVVVFQPAGLSWDMEASLQAIREKVRIFSDTGKIIDYLRGHLQKDDHVLVMSNGGFERLHQRLIETLAWVG